MGQALVPGLFQITPTMNDPITIRPMTTYDEFLACEDIQRLAWKMDGDRDVVPAHMLKPLAEYGGIVLGAFNDSGKLVGFVYGFIGRVDDQRVEWMATPYILCSEMMGVLPEYRSQAVGYRLKLAQRDFALAEGFKLIVWTYDPLLSLNANLNIAKLGCVCRRYVEDAYGQMSGIYAGLNTDRFSVEWWIASQHVKSVLEGETRMLDLDTLLSEGLSIINPTTPGGAGLPRPGRDLSGNDARLLVEVPANIQRIKEADLALAQDWRAHTRELFEAAFDRSYVVTGFVRGPASREQSSFYVLTNQLDIESMARETHEN
jgi:predicted GNAT superfamily acetyltransferase